ncbi:hypothetical protein [Gordonia sp. OPL2]|uniref:hypothetical protein n=1 Tax=Gordonia sp. OPL2 TaxID=2486274 RepID=UPI0016551339|nr:hypothetical protein [Gordonia sp. OPL2]
MSSRRMTTSTRGVAAAMTISMLAGAVGGCAQQSDDPAPGSVTTSVVTVTRSVTPSSSDTTSTTTTAATAYTPTAIRAQGRRGSTTFDVDLPQVSGGETAVRERFNSGMRAALDDVVGRTADTTVEDGSLAGDTHSAVTTTTGTVVAGVAIFSAYAAGAAHPNNLVSTITINATTAKPILLSDVLTDPNATSPRLAALVTQIDDRATDVPPVVDSFLNWVPVTAGIRFYVPVIHALGDWLPVTVPWNDLSAYLRPGMAEFLGGP